MRRRHIVLALLGAFGLTLGTHRLGAQAPVAPAAAILTIAGEVNTPLSLTAGDLQTMPRTKVQVEGEDKRTVVYEGVLVGELLRRAGATLGNDLRGTALTTYVMARASDGYEVLFALAELDPALTPSSIIVADTIEGKPLAGNQGPFRIVAPRDARPARGVRMLERLDVVRLRR